MEGVQTRNSLPFLTVACDAWPRAGSRNIERSRDARVVMGFETLPAPRNRSEPDS